MNKVFEENPKNIYVIKHNLGGLKKNPSSSCFYYPIGNYTVKIFTHAIQEANDFQYCSVHRGVKSLDKSSDDSITLHKTVDAQVYESLRDPKGQPLEVYVNLDTDSRFSNYKPIKHGEWNRTGTDMPILNLCELIKYLHRLSNLAVFI